MGHTTGSSPAGSCIPPTPGGPFSPASGSPRREADTPRYARGSSHTLLLIESLFLLGVASFLVGHLLYIVTFLFETGLKNYRKNLLVFLIICLIYFYIETEVLRYFRPALLKFGLWGPLFAYTSILSALNISSAIYAYCYRNIYSILAYIGSIIFYISDCILAKQLFFGYNKYHQITIMFTYILGQSLISLGMANKANSFELGIIKDSLKKII